MEESDNIILLENVLERTLSFITKAESKIPPILVIDTSMLGVIAALIPKFSHWTNFFIIFSILTVVPLLLSLIFLFIAQFPRTKSPEDSLLYFGGIVSTSFDKYKKKIKAIESKDYFNDLASQTYRNSEIANTKYKWVRYSLIALFMAIIPWLIVIFNLYKMSS